MNYEIKVSNEGDVFTKLELKGRGIRKICVNLAGENVYSVTPAAKHKLVNTYVCAYENGNDQLVEMK